MESNSGKELSGREQEIIRLAALGYCDKEIGAELGLQISTVRTYWDRIRIKTKSRSRTHAVCSILAPQHAREMSGALGPAHYDISPSSSG